MKQSARNFLAEMIGTFGLIFFGAGAILQQQATQSVGTTGIAVAHGLAILIGVYAFGHISGAHFNPAVSFGMWITRRIGLGKMFTYWVAQLLGASLAALILSTIYQGGPVDVHLGTPAIDPTIGPKTGFAIEAILTFFLVTAVFGTAVDPRAPNGFAGLAIGLTITACVLMGGALTGAAMNPARAFGPALASHYWQDQWVYWAGPLVGGGVAAILYDRFFLARA
ncbi:MAG TPA: MIP/aquaporin family protein [Candidatus Limnocylindrales bacterium]|jgi:MIP family channel proteins|nr:MIP/aquaporin family protein [Candidatus Limnocylindrales bacterium]